MTIILRLVISSLSLYIWLLLPSWPWLWQIAFVSKHVSHGNRTVDAYTTDFRTPFPFISGTALTSQKVHRCAENIDPAGLVVPSGAVYITQVAFPFILLTTIQPWHPPGAGRFCQQPVRSPSGNWIFSPPFPWMGIDVQTIARQASRMIVFPLSTTIYFKLWLFNHFFYFME